MRYVGVCYDSGGWGGDLTGLLLVETVPGGWESAAGHISSSESYSRSDITRRYQDRGNPMEDDSFEWVGRLTHEDIAERYPAAASGDEVDD